MVNFISSSGNVEEIHILQSLDAELNSIIIDT